MRRPTLVTNRVFTLLNSTNYNTTPAARMIPESNHLAYVSLPSAKQKAEQKRRTRYAFHLLGRPTICYERGWRRRVTPFIIDPHEC